MMMTDDYAGPDAKATLIRVEGKAKEKGTTYVILFCLFFFFFFKRLVQTWVMEDIKSCSCGTK